MPKKRRITIRMTPTFQIVRYISSGQKNLKQYLWNCKQNSWLTINPSWRRALEDHYKISNIFQNLKSYLRVNWMKSVPSSSWWLLLSLFRTRGARVDPRPWRLQGESDIFVWTGQFTWRESGNILLVEKVKTLQEVILLNISTSVDNWEEDSLMCSLRRHPRCPSPPSPEQGTRSC